MNERKKCIFFISIKWLKSFVINLEKVRIPFVTSQWAVGGFFFKCEVCFQENNNKTWLYVLLHARNLEIESKLQVFFHQYFFF